MSAQCTLVYICNAKKGKVRRHAWQELLFNCLHFLGFKSLLMRQHWRNTLARLPVPFQNVASFAFTLVTPLGIDANLAAVVLIGFTLVQICNGIRKCSCWYFLDICLCSNLYVETYTLNTILLRFVCVSASMSNCLYVCIYVFDSLCFCVCVCVCICVCLFVSVSVLVSMSMSVSVSVFLSVCVWVCICLDVYVFLSLLECYSIILESSIFIYDGFIRTSLFVNKSECLSMVLLLLISWLAII